MVVKTSIGFLTTDTDAQLIVDVQSAISGMTGNANFVTPTPTLASITTALNAFTVALADAGNGGTELTSIKNAKRAELVSHMRQLASYVTVTAKRRYDEAALERLCLPKAHALAGRETAGAGYAGTPA